ncbi:antitoxin [Agrococcus baldri]|uniref:antitoxin n=1 Tax=Agrococcus baldri TaxID=153730 RepID=UPI00296F7873|nr:antitoxin [Agrococcus baldri]
MNKGKDALNSEQGEQMSDQAIQGAGDGFDTLTGGRFAEHTDGVQERADGFLGQQEQQDQQDQQQQ